MTAVLRLIEERLVGGATHLVALAGATHLYMNFLLYPTFPWKTLLFFGPNLLLALLYWSRSRLLFAQVVQALIAHICSLGLALIPWMIWVLRAKNIMGDEWSEPSVPWLGITPEWALAAILLSILGACVFVLMADAAISGFSGRVFQYPIIGRFSRWLTDSEGPALPLDE